MWDQHTMFALDDWLKVCSLSSKEHKKLLIVVNMTNRDSLGIQTIYFGTENASRCWEYHFFLDKVMIFSLNDWLKVSSLSSEDHKKLSIVVNLTNRDSLGIQTSTFRTGNAFRSWKYHIFFRPIYNVCTRWLIKSVFLIIRGTQKAIMRGNFY